MTRHQFIKRIVLVGAAVGGAGMIVGSESMLDELSRGRELAHRDQARPRDSIHWFTAHEYTLISALAALIVPSDDIGPGARKAGMMDKLDYFLVSSQKGQSLYARGLLGFDELARHKYRRSFAELTSDQQVQLLELVDETSEKFRANRTALVDKVSRKVMDLYYTWPSPGTWSGLDAAMRLFPTLVRDILKAFYTSQVAWDWLGYDGPPFPRGYIGRMDECRPT